METKQLILLFVIIIFFIEMNFKDCGKIEGMVGPEWTRGEIEKPEGEKDMGEWKENIYTKEQQNRLNIDEKGQKLPDNNNRHNHNRHNHNRHNHNRHIIHHHYPHYPHYPQYIYSDMIWEPRLTSTYSNINNNNGNNNRNNNNGNNNRNTNRTININSNADNYWNERRKNKIKVYLVLGIFIYIFANIQKK